MGATIATTPTAGSMKCEQHVFVPRGVYELELDEVVRLVLARCEGCGAMLVCSEGDSRASEWDLLGVFHEVLCAREELEDARREVGRLRGELEGFWERETGSVWLPIDPEHPALVVVLPLEAEPLVFETVEEEGARARLLDWVRRDRGVFGFVRAALRDRGEG